jgi:hypothetical protein
MKMFFAYKLTYDVMDSLYYKWKGMEVVKRVAA